jgi:hypothetical protein
VVTESEILRKLLDGDEAERATKGEGGAGRRVHIGAD